MKRLLTAAMLIAAPLTAAVAQPQGSSQEAPAAAAGVDVREQGLVATWFPPASGKRGPAILVLAGSEGGTESSKRVATAFAAEGYGVLGLAWFNAEGLPEQLQDIPLEYFGKAIAWMMAQPLVDPKRIGLWGMSKGGEAALLIASRHPEVAAVVASVPSSVVWQGINYRNYAEVKSSFAEDGKPMAFVPYDASAPFTGILDLYERSLAKAGEHPDAAIPVERIGGPLLLLSAKADALWPSTAMAEQVMARLDARGFKPRHQHIAYPDAGHGALVPPLGPVREGQNSSQQNMGGTEAGNAAARSDGWAKTKAFFADALGAPAR